MAYTLSADEAAKVRYARDLMLKGTAPQIPFDATVIQDLGVVAASSGFMTTGQFAEQCKDKPISTLIDFLLYVGA